MAKFRLDTVALVQAFPALGDEYVAQEALHELARQLRPHVPGATPGEGLGSLLNRLLPQEPPADLVEEMVKLYQHTYYAEYARAQPDGSACGSDELRSDRAAMGAVLRALSQGDARDWLPSEDAAVDALLTHWEGDIWRDRGMMALAALDLCASHIAPRLAALRAEYERKLSNWRDTHKQFVTQAADAMQAAQAELDAMRAENEQLREELAAAKRQAHIAEGMLADAQREAGR